MVKLLGLAIAAVLACAMPRPALADDPAQVMEDLLEELTGRQDEPLAAVLAELRAECEEGDEPDPCLVTALRPYLLEASPAPGE